jgi:hypothetical protein
VRSVGDARGGYPRARSRFRREVATWSTTTRPERPRSSTCARRSVRWGNGQAGRRDRVGPQARPGGARTPSRDADPPRRGARCEWRRGRFTLRRRTRRPRSGAGRGRLGHCAARRQQGRRGRRSRLTRPDRVGAGFWAGLERVVDREGAESAEWCCDRRDRLTRGAARLLHPFRRESGALNPVLPGHDRPALPVRE